VHAEMETGVGAEGLAEPEVELREGVGGGEAAAHAIGVNIFRTKMTAFVICGVCAAFAGILGTTRVLSVQPGQGAGMELQAIAA